MFFISKEEANIDFQIKEEICITFVYLKKKKNLRMHEYVFYRKGVEMITSIINSTNLKKVTSLT